MEHTDLYKINLRSLSEGTHDFSFELGDRFFADVESDEIQGGRVSVEVVIKRSGDLYRAVIDCQGFVFVSCDRCLTPLLQEVDSEREVVVKFGDEYSEPTDELVIVPEEGVWDLAWPLYEDIVLSLPMQRLHEDGECDEEMLDLYESMLVSSAGEEELPEEYTEDIERDEDGIDVRWAALKALKKD